MASKPKEVLEYLREYPKATNQEIAETCHIQVSNAKKIISDFKRREWIKVEGKGTDRHITVIKEEIKSGPGFKRQTYEEMVAALLDDFEDVSNYKERVEIGNMIFKILKEM